jgi:Histidine kinase-, DNA gyrase B-, and HSP90-like ATPase
MAPPRPDGDILKVVASPAKRFFVSMLVKDIELIPAIMDLVDNSIDGAKGLRPEFGDERFRGLTVAITVNADRFEIVDNCGGIDADKARNYAFRFGRPEDQAGPFGEVGQFGVGMKRALFKLGTQFRVDSAAPSSRFSLPVNVSDWLADASLEWSFEFETVEEGVVTDPAERGTRIEVNALHEWVAREFATQRLVDRLQSEIELRHMRPLQQGLAIRLNGRELAPAELVLLQGPDFVPLVKERQIPTNGSHLDMRLYAGVVRLADQNDDATDDPDRFPTESPAGWYLFCNDRLLIAHDTSRLTGWGEAVASYHPQYRQFRGYVFLSGEAKYMPWTTTKTSVDEDSAVFRTVQTEMFDALQKAVAVLNRLKNERQQRPEEDRPAVAAMRAAQPLSIEQLPASPRFTLPPAPPALPTTVKWIRYSVDLEDFARAAAEVGSTSPADVGRETFRYFLETRVPD